MSDIIDRDVTRGTGERPDRENKYVIAAHVSEETKSAFMGLLGKRLTPVNLAFHHMLVLYFERCGESIPESLALEIAELEKGRRRRKSFLFRDRNSSS
jgi:hypothetical protein